MADLLDRIMRLWMDPPADDEAAVAAFRELYADPVPVNGEPMSAADLLARARALHRAYDDLRHEPVREVDVPGTLVVAFRMRGRHTGPLSTPIGDVAPTGREVEVLTIDILTVADGRVTEVWVVADQLGQLARIGALLLK
ncbi:ester cyclase [Streptomyces sp. NPDC047043]|uniref:ester cyclase n=1 Tax=Streptomyces sp. NPDC047043 TaxID=3154497 RepID=UPI0033F6C33D